VSARRETSADTAARFRDLRARRVGRRCSRCDDIGCAACDRSAQLRWLRFAAAWGQIGLRVYVRMWWASVVAQGRAESETQE
jgi:hypothetical protein